MPEFDDVSFGRLILPLRDLSEEEIVLETEYLRKDATCYPVEIRIQRTRHDSRQAFVAHIWDLSEERRLKDQAETNADLYLSLIDQSTDLVWRLNTEGVFTFFSPSLKSMLGFEPIEAVGTRIVDVFSGADREKIKRALTNATNAGPTNTETMVFELTHTRRDGSVFPGEANCTTLLDDDGRAIGIQGITRDISGRKQIEEELQKVDQLESLGVLAGGIAHDVNNVLAGIVGNISLARISSESDERDDHLSLAEGAALRIRDLSSQLLTFSKGGAPSLRNLDVGPLLEETVRFALSGSNVASESDVADSLWTVQADSGQIGQVVNNLVLNAKQAMPKGGVLKVAAHNVSTLENPVALLQGTHYVRITVQDEGTGIPDEQIKKIFDPFFTTKATGNGLGLATSHSIIQQHSGHIDVQSQPGEGTCFDVYLPAHPDSLPDQLKTRSDALIHGKGRILVMDDEESIRDLSVALLNRLGYDALVVGDGAEAIESYQKHMLSAGAFSAVILDLTVPGGMGGEEAISMLQELDPDVKAICASGYAHSAVISNYHQYGFGRALAKPYRLSELAQALNDLIGPSASEEKAQGQA